MSHASFQSGKTFSKGLQGLLVKLLSIWHIPTSLCNSVKLLMLNHVHISLLFSVIFVILFVVLPVLPLYCEVVSSLR